MSFNTESSRRIANATRFVEANQKLPGAPYDPNRRHTVRIVEGYLLGPLGSTTDPNVPESAEFQVKETLMDDGWGIPSVGESVIKVLNRTADEFAADDSPMMAAELYPSKWFLLAGGGAKYTEIQFKPLDICPGIGSACDCVTAEVLKITCGGSGVNVGDTVNVWDPDQANFDIPIDLLLNTSGWAKRVVVPDALRYSLPEDPGPCWWQAYTMACVEESAYA